MRRKTTSCVFPRRSAAFFADMLSPEGGKRLTKSATIESANSSTSLVLNGLLNMDLILSSALGALHRAQAVEQRDIDTAVQVALAEMRAIARVEKVRVEDHRAVRAVGHAHRNAAHRVEVAQDRRRVLVVLGEAPVLRRIVRVHEQAAVLGVEIRFVFGDPEIDVDCRGIGMGAESRKSAVALVAPHHLQRQPAYDARKALAQL